MFQMHEFSNDVECFGCSKDYVEDVKPNLGAVREVRRYEHADDELKAGNDQ
jgi:hypothetical protein